MMRPTESDITIPRFLQTVFQRDQWIQKLSFHSYKYLSFCQKFACFIVYNGMFRYDTS